ncbi:hypothetical protein L7F22_010494 [Adiantum nelumboides]|nr:hypothetical protein [Adiantum nelumboides]
MALHEALRDGFSQPEPMENVAQHHLKSLVHAPRPMSMRPPLNVGAGVGFVNLYSGDQPRSYASMANQPSQIFPMGMPYSHDQLRPIYEVPSNSFFSNLLHKEMDNNQGVNGKNVGDSGINPLFMFDKKGKSTLDQELNPSLGGEDLNFDKAGDPGSTPTAVIIPSFELESWYNQLQDRVIIELCHGSRPSLESLRVWMNQNWSNRNIRVNHVQYLPNGYYLFFCEDPNSALQIVSQGQWILRNTPISVFNWYLGFYPKGPKPTKAPVWVDFVDLPVELYPWLKR